MTQKNRLASVSDSEFLPLYRSLVAFLVHEADSRQWLEVSRSLKAVEAALAGVSERPDT